LEGGSCCYGTPPSVISVCVMMYRSSCARCAVPTTTTTRRLVVPRVRGRHWSSSRCSVKTPATRPGERSLAVPCFLRPTRVRNGTSTRSAVLAQLTAEYPYTYSRLSPRPMGSSSGRLSFAEIFGIRKLESLGQLKICN